MPRSQRLLQGKKKSAYSGAYSSVNQMTAIGGYLYVATNTAVLKINISTMRTVGRWRPSVGYVIAITSDATYIYVGLDVVPSTVVKINASTMKEATTNSRYRDENGFNGVNRLMPGSAGKIYALTNDIPSNILRLSTVDMSMDSAWQDTDTSGGVGYDMTILGAYLYICYYTGAYVPATVTKMDIAAGTFTHWASGSDTLINAWRIVNDGTYLYVSLDITQATVIKINPTNLATLGTWTGAAGQEYATGLAYGSALYVGTETAPFKTLTVNTETMQTAITYTGAATMKDCYDILCSGTDVFASYIDSKIHGRIDKLDATLNYVSQWIGK